MYSSLSASKRLLLIHFLAIQLHLINSELSLNTTNEYLNHKCLANQGKYKPGSPYEERLIFNIKRFYVASRAEMLGYTWHASSNFSAIIQCRGDSYGPKCQECFTTALAALRRRCPWYKWRMIWYDQCLLALTSYDSIGKIDYDNIFCMSNAKKLGGDKVAFTRTWKTLMNNLTTLATTKVNYTQPTALYAVGETRFKGDTVYGMVQCTKDISPRACRQCMALTSKRFQDCLNDKRGARFVGRTCSFRFEFYPFIAKPVQNI